MGGFRQRGTVRYGAVRCGMVDARSVWARVGGCLEVEFKDLAGLDGLETRFNMQWRRFAGPADISNALRAPSRHNAELAAGISRKLF